MSADNGYAVMRLEDHPGYYGIFHYYASADYSQDWYVGENAEATYESPIWAILSAHQRDNRVYTEYNVIVSSPVIEDAIMEYNAKCS